MVEKTVFAEKSHRQFFVNGIVYLFDETETDTFAYVQSIHKDLVSTYPEFLGSSSSSSSSSNQRFSFYGGLLCNMINSGGVPSNSGPDDALRLIENLERLLDQSSSGSIQLEYVTQKYEETILGSRPVIESSDESSNGENKLKIGLDSLVTRILQPSHVDDEDDGEGEEAKETLSIKSTEHSLKSAPLQTLMKKKATRNYLGEMNRNLRNGSALLIIFSF